MRQARAIQLPLGDDATTNAKASILLVPSHMSVGAGTSRTLRLRAGFRDVTLVQAALAALLAPSSEASQQKDQSATRTLAESSATGSGVSLELHIDDDDNAAGAGGAIEPLPLQPKLVAPASVDECVASPSNIAVRASLAFSSIEIMLVNDFAGAHVPVSSTLLS